MIHGLVKKVSFTSFIRVNALFCLGFALSWPAFAGPELENQVARNKKIEAGEALVSLAKRGIYPRTNLTAAIYTFKRSYQLAPSSAGRPPSPDAKTATALEAMGNAHFELAQYDKKRKFDHYMRAIHYLSTSTQLREDGVDRRSIFSQKKAKEVNSQIIELVQTLVKNIDQEFGYNLNLRLKIYFLTQLARALEFRAKISSDPKRCYEDALKIYRQIIQLNSLKATQGTPSDVEAEAEARTSLIVATILGKLALLESNSKAMYNHYQDAVVKLHYALEQKNSQGQPSLPGASIQKANRQLDDLQARLALSSLGMGITAELQQEKLPPSCN